jgi:peptidoglycan-associated lipoprotein
MNRNALLISLLLGASALTACSKKAPEVLPPAPSGASGAQPSASMAQGAQPGSQADFLAQMRGQDTIYFDTDRFNIDSADAAALQAQANWLRQYPQKRAVLEGHADERGTREYNIALGERRANSARNYLVSLGIDATRLSVVSYGKERPVALGSDESSWARNRRAVTVTID